MRDLFVSAAQVARYYKYTLDEALKLSHAQRSLLISVAIHEEKRQFGMLEQILGTRWSTASLVSEASGAHAPPGEFVSAPLLPMLAPQAFQSFVEGVRSRAKHVDVEVSTLSKDDAKKFFEGL